MEKNKSTLGKGLGALLGDAEYTVISPHSAARVKSDVSGYIRIDLIEVNPFQPRSDFDQETLEELAQSIKSYGLIQPVTVRPIEQGKYQLIAGERRLRAAKLAGLKEVPAYIRTADDIQTIQMALVENIQREDLNAIEIAISYQRLIEECNLSQEELSEKVGKDRSTIANYLRLLKLSLQSQIAVRDNKISMGHARAMVVIEDDELQNKLLNEIIKNGLSVRQTESLVKKYNAEQGVVKRKMKLTLSPSVTDFQVEFSKKLKTKVSISKTSTGKGKISIPFTSPEDLERIINILK
ncbi:MAG TPA: ParB/RepB/Spo0J family partition protein [Bacteroidales bacterium]|jgi:ParB family chromosome partitioning protein|nr:ParB/RepB/Spo0J family partition protein [Bacteroidales bacterium]HOS58412.1 ParB/RepB/Spo0J family partition protein [Bacteroidales bacterium]HPY81430.1 ParB/RepB/Spo0J family partition protein [Bacteroidales bacterium]HRR04023.1 ParB/RepB/Spo0J family partition protein [Bacteroidales bacterium]HRT14198.1 ParB/RepB/Spo0J family partition protein [Bacteroidales bacterium]